MDWLSISVIALLVLYLGRAAMVVLMVVMSIVKKSFYTMTIIPYIIAGFSMAMAFKLTTPAMTWQGVGYMSAIWPVWQAQGITGYQPPIPDWMFNFKLEE